MLANRGGETYRVADLVGLEFLALVRHGLRAASDPRVVDTVAVVDATLRVELRGHPYFHRYQDDGYGEHTDGSPFDGSGIGRAWPLLAGERGHYAIGHGEDPLPYLRAMAASTGRGHLIPEQVWDTDAIAQRRLFPGSPSGSAMPLVWAHAEFLKLHSAAVHGVAFDRIAAVAERYATERNTGVAHIRDEPRIVTSATTLVIRWSGPFLLHIGTNGWTSPRDLTSKPSAFGLHEVRVERSAFAEASTLEFTRQHLDTLEWEGHDHVVTLA